MMEGEKFQTSDLIISFALNAMKEDSIEAKRGEGKFRHSALLIQAMR